MKNTLFPLMSILEEEVIDWYKMSPAERFIASQKLWEVFVLICQLNRYGDPQIPEIKYFLVYHER
jgi:hypothetical protein